MKHKTLKLAYKPSLRRRVLVIQPPTESLTSTDKKTIRQIQQSLEGINPDLSVLINRLAEVTNYPVPEVSVEILRTEGDNPDLSAYFISDDPFVSNTRACVCLVDLSDPPSSQQLRSHLHASHLVVAKLSSTHQGWFEDSANTVTVVNTVIHKLSRLIEDIMLDIAMFHSWSFVSDFYGTTLEQKQAFSTLKCAYAIAHPNSSYYGPIRSPNLSYFPLAALCRHRTDFDLIRYETIWAELLQPRILLDASSSPHKSLDHALNHILKHHPKAGQIQLKALRRAITPLPPGSYVLLTTQSRPHRTRVSKTLELMFSLSSWRTNRIKVVPFTEWSQYARYFPWISLFKFTVL